MLSLTNKAERFLRLKPPSARACSQLEHLQKASGKALDAAVPRNVTIIYIVHTHHFCAGANQSGAQLS